MTRTERDIWVWSEACAAIERTVRLQHQFSGRGGVSSNQMWQPPIDLFEFEDDVVVVAALPGVAVQSVEVSVERGVLSIFGHRSFPPELRHAAIHVLEIPWGRFARRVRLPRTNLVPRSCTMTDGCLRIVLAKVEEKKP